MDMILKNTFQSISPAYELIGDVTVGSNTTQVDFTGLNIGKDDELLLVGNLSLNNAYYRITINNNDTTTNYYSQSLMANSTAVTGARWNEPVISDTAANSNGNLFISKLKLTNSGDAVYQSSTTRFLGSSIRFQDIYGTSTFQTATMTSVKITATATNGIATGSRFQLYKLVAEKVADIIVPNNTTSVDITGLDIGKENEYYLVSDVVNGTSSNMGIAMFVNTNNTLTNYYIQRLWAEGPSVGGSRSNNSYFSIVSGTSGQKNTFTSANLKLANSGYFVLESKGLRGYGGVFPQIENYSATTTFTASEITSIKLQSDITNSIGANSRFTLYKMK